MNSAQLQAEMRDVVENNILRFWLNEMVDHKQGGFYGQMLGDGTVVKDAVRGAILTARLLWAFAAAYRVLGTDAYLSAAQRAKDYLLTHFLDNEYGGVYWAVDCRGVPVDTKKQFYALGFALYGLAEYARATGEDAALRSALQLFDTIETRALDKQYNGYLEALTRQWQPIDDMRLSEKDANYPKSQNTHLHILEPYANLLRCLKERGAETESIDRVGRALRNLIALFCEKIISPSTAHLRMFFSRDWTPAPEQLISYGHDIECSWLLHEAALILGDSDVLAAVVPVVRRLAAAAEEGLAADGALIYEADSTTGYADRKRHWWVQAEAVVGYYNIYQHFGDERALDTSLRCWQYIKAHLIDYARGEWYARCDEKGTPCRADDRAGFWKCPYHNSRMCLELIERINKQQ